MEAVFKEKSYPANYPADALAIINAMSFSDGRNVKIMGSMGMRSQQYAGDYDLFEEVQTKGSEPEALRHLANKFKDIVKTLLRTKNIYVGDIKSGAIPEWEILNTNAGIVDGKIANYNAVESNHRIDELEKAKIISGGEAKYARSLIKESMTPEDLIEAKKELKFHIVRWSPNEVLHGSKVLRDKKRYTLEEAFSSTSLTKLDVIGFIQNNRFTDFSIIYEFFNNGKALNDFPLNVSQALKEDIIYYKAHGNHFKVLKRMLALAKLNKDSETVNKLVPILNSDLGRLYLIISDVGTLIELLENERKVPMPLVRFELDQMKARMGNIYNLPDFLSEEHDLIGDINAILKMTNKPQLLSRLHQIKTKMEGILNTNAKAKGGRRGGATEAERGRAAKLREKYFSGKYGDFGNRFYQDLSLIAHDPYDGSVAEGKSLISKGRPYLEDLAKNIMKGIVPSGYPLERIGFFNPTIGQLPPPPENATEVSQPPADNSWFDPTNRYNDTEDAWKAFLLGNPHYSSKGRYTAKTATPADEAEIRKYGWNQALAQTTPFSTVNPAIYNRSVLKPPTGDVPTPPQDVFLEQLEELATTRPPLVPRGIDPNDEAIEQAQAIARAEQERIDELTRRLGKTEDAYALLLREQYVAPPAGVDTGAVSRNLAEIAELEPLAEAQRNEAMAEEEAYTRDYLRREYEASEAGKAQMAQEAEARKRAEAQAREQAREQARVEADARARQAEADRAEVARLEAEAQARQQASAGEKGAIDALERVFTDKKELAKIPEPDKGKVKVLMKAVEKGKIALLTITQLAGFKAKKLALEAELRALPAGKASKKRKAEIEEDLELMPPELDKDLATAERHKQEFMTAEEQLREIFTKYILPKKEEEEEITTINQRPKNKALSTSPEFSAEETSKIIKQIKQPRQKGILTEVNEIFSVNESVTQNIKHAIKMTEQIKKLKDEGKMSEEEFNKEVDRIPVETIKQFIVTQVANLVEKPSFFVIARHNPEFADMIKEGIEGRMEQSFPIRKYETQRKALRGLAEQTFAGIRFFDNIFASYAPIPDDRLLTIAQMAEEASEVIKPAITVSITANRNFMAQVEQVGKIMLEAVEGIDEHMFVNPQSELLRRWLQSSRVLLAGYTPFERNIMFSATAMKWNDGKQFDLVFPPEWLEGRIVFPDGLGGAGRRRRVRGGITIAFPPTENGKRDFLKWVNRNWNSIITKQHRDARPLKFRQIFTDPFPYTLGKSFRTTPRYYIIYNTRTKNVRVKPLDFSKPSDDEFMAVEFGVPIHRRDYDDFFKNDLKEPRQEFSEVLQTPPASPREGEGRVRNKSFARMMAELK